jgi:hypothetical protein
MEMLVNIGVNIEMVSLTYAFKDVLKSFNKQVSPVFKHQEGIGQLFSELGAIN